MKAIDGARDGSASIELLLKADPISGWFAWIITVGSAIPRWNGSKGPRIC